MSHRDFAVPLALVLIGSTACTDDDATQPPSPGPLTYAAHELGAGRCTSINDRGDVIGIGNDDIPFRIQRDGSDRTSLGTMLADAVTVPTGVGADGTIVGFVQTQTARIPVVRTNTSTAWRRVDGVAGDGAALAVDPSGAIVGFVYSPDGTDMFVAGGGTAPTIPDQLSSAGYAMNGAGAVAGIVETGDGETHGFVTEGGALVDIGTLGGENSTALAMNAAGDVVGAAEDAAGLAHAVYRAAGADVLIDLGLPEGAISSDARGIDDEKRIGGNVVMSAGGGRPFVFRPGADPVPLLPTDAGGVPYVGARISAVAPSGAIVGWGVPKGVGLPQCLVWTPEVN